MVAITAEYPVDSPARQTVRRSSPIMPVNVPAFVDKIDIPVVVGAQRPIARADRIAAIDARKRAALAASGEGV